VYSARPLYLIFEKKKIETYLWLVSRAHNQEILTHCTQDHTSRDNVTYYQDMLSCISTLFDPFSSRLNFLSFSSWPRILSVLFVSTSSRSKETCLHPKETNIYPKETYLYPKAWNTYIRTAIHHSSTTYSWESSWADRLCYHISSRDLTGGSPSTSMTVYPKHVHVMFNQQTASLLQTLGA